MSLSDEYIPITMTIEQMAALRTILKLEYIATMGSWLEGQFNGEEPINSITHMGNIIAFSDVWATLDRPFGTALNNCLGSPDGLSLHSPVTASVGKMEYTAIQRVLKDRIYYHHITKARDAPIIGPAVSNFVTVVLIDRNLDAIERAFDVTHEPVPQVEEKPFMFEMPPVKGVN